MKNNNIFRLFALLIACLILLASLTCCAAPAETGNGTETLPQTADSSSGNEDGDPADTGSSANVDKDGFLLDDIPDSVKFPGKEISVLYWSDVENPEFFAEDANGDIVENAIYSRNSAVESRLGVTLRFDGTPGNNSNNENYVKRVSASYDGGDAYDIYSAYSMTTASVAYAGYCENLLKYDTMIDFSKPWWPDSLITEATINNKLYFCSGDISTNLLYMMYAVYFNKGMIKSYGLDDPYDCVDNDTWTYETMFRMANTVAGSHSASNDVYGFVVSSNVHLDPFFYGAGLRTTERDADGMPVISASFGGELATTVVSEVWTFLHQDGNKLSDGKTLFPEGQALFAMDRARFASEQMSDSETDFGVVPVPKYSADQTTYSTCMGFPYSLYAISVGSEQKEAAAYVLECMASESYRKITPALFELSMKERYVLDSKASRMFDIIRAGVTFDLGRIFAASLQKVTYSTYRNALYKDTEPNYTSAYKSIARGLKLDLEALVQKFASFEQ